jgi:glycosyltransferase involved in cell wall biosynthesis
MKENDKLPISVFIITLNESAHIEKTLRSIQRCSEIVVVDSGSTDNTIDIAKRYGARVINHSWQGYAKQKQIAMNLCNYDWVLNLDGDEEITPEILNELSIIIEDKIYGSVRLKRIDQFIGEFPNNFVKKQNNLRFYRKFCARFDVDKLVHESANVTARELKSKNHFYHYGYDDIHILQEKMNKYSSLKAEEKFINKTKHSITKLILIFPLTFIKRYAIDRLFMFGTRGFIKAIMESHYSFIKQAKLYERYQRELIKNK